MGLDWMEWENGKKTTTNGMVELLLGEVSINCNLANLRKSANNCHFLINIFFLLKPCKKKKRPLSNILSYFTYHTVFYLQKRKIHFVHTVWSQVIFHKNMDWMSQVYGEKGHILIIEQFLKICHNIYCSMVQCILFYSHIHAKIIIVNALAYETTRIAHLTW